MVLVLMVLGAYYSLVTNSLQQPTDEDAARQLAGQVSRNSSVLLVARSGDEDAQFLKALGTAIRTRGANLVGSIQGEPRDARITLEKLNGEGKVLEFIATTKDCAAWPLLQNVGMRFPALGQP